MLAKRKPTAALAKLQKENARLKNELARFEQVFDSIPHLMFVKDSKGQFIWVNKSAANFYGLSSPDQLIGKCDSDFNPNQNQVKHYVADEQRVISGRQTIHIKKEANTDFSGKTHWLNTIKVPMENQDGSIYVVIVATFIDELVTLEQRLNDEKLRAENHKSMALLASKLTHKLATRIATVENRLFVLPISETVMEEALNALDRLKEFGNEFLKLANSNRVKIGRTNLLLILRNSIKLPKNSSTTIFVNGKSWPSQLENDSIFDLLADEHMLEDVFAELLSNSIKVAKPELHSINIDIHPCPKESVARIDPNPHPKSLRILFRDNGPGVPGPQKQLIFEPFISASPEGTGLGLSIVREIVKAHGGDIAEIGSAGKGACFEIILPTNLAASV